MHEKMLWYNDNIQFLINKNIVEYDMVAASVSVSDVLNLLPKNVIDELKLLPKEKRTRRVGCLQRDDKEYSEKLLAGIRDIRKEFLLTNNLDESNVITLHSDAIFFSSKKKINNIVHGVEFKHKNTWSSYIRYGKVEMFYNNGVIDYKGIPQDMIYQHTLGINKYLINIFQMLEDLDTDIYDYITTFQKNYLQDRLPEYYYTSFGKFGQYKLENLHLFSYIAKIVMYMIK